MSIRLNLEQLRKQAKERLAARRAAGETIKLSQVQHELAREHGYASWAKLHAHLAAEVGHTSSEDAWAAVLEHLTRPRTRPEPPETTSTGGDGDRRPRPGSGRGGLWFAPDLGTLEIVKHRVIEGRHFWVLSFDSDGYQTLDARIRLEGVFRAAPAASGGWQASGYPQRVWDPQRPFPWANLAGSIGLGNGPTFVHGRVHPAGRDVTRVRLRAPDGTELEDDTGFEDDTGGGWVILFTTRQLDPPFTIELLDSTGEIVAAQTWGSELAP